MTWYVKYRVEYTDDLGVDWKVHFKKQAASAFTIVDYQATGQPLIFEWYGDDDPFRQRIQGSKANISIWCPNDFELLDLFSADIQEYQVIIYQNSTLFWKGYVLPGEYQEAYDQPPLNVNIGASDGLGLLKEFQFDDLGYGFVRQRFAKVIYDILGLIEWTQFKEFINLYSSNMSSGTGDSPLDQVGLDPQLFKTATCYDALEAILKMFNAGIKQDIGEMIIYRFIEIQASMHGRKFTSATAKTYVTKNPDQFISRTAQPSHIRDVEGGALTMIPQASKHIINYDFGFKESALRNWDFHYDDFVLDGTWTIPEWTVFNTPVIYPLNERETGEEHGIYIERGTGALGGVKQEIEGVKTRSPQFRLIFDYRLRNTGATSYYINVTYRLSIVGASTQYWRARDNVWSSNSDSESVFAGDAEPRSDDHSGWSSWMKADILISGVPIDGKLVLELYEVATGTDPWNQVKVMYKDVKLVMTPLAGGEDTGIGYTYPAATRGRIIEHEHILGDGFTSARHAVNQLLSYSGIINMYDNGNILDPLTSGGTVWSTRGNTEEQTIYEVINDEMGAQYVRTRHLIDLPVWVDDPATFISSVGNLQDVLNKVGGNNRKFHVGVRSFNAKTRDYQLVVSEII